MQQAALAVTSPELSPVQDASLASAAAADGEVFDGRYLVERSLKSGNGVDTFLAHDLRTDTAVVLKSIDSSVVHAAAWLRLEHESVVLRHLSGTGLPGLHDANFSEDRIYLVQRFVQGVTLEALLAAGPLPLRSTLDLGIASRRLSASPTTRGSATGTSSRRTSSSKAATPSRR